MIEYIELVNFQKYEYKRMEFSDSVTCITGLNGEGKSTILRAIVWVAMNEGDSKSYRRVYVEDNAVKTAQETSVEIGVDGHVIKRVLSSSKNEYWVDGTKATGFGRSVPESVSGIFKMCSLNISEQFSQLFLLGETSGGAVAKALNEVASLEEMDELVYLINSDMRKHTSEIDRLTNEVSSVEEQENILKSFDELSTIYSNMKCITDSCYPQDDLELLESTVQMLSKTGVPKDVKSLLSDVNSFTLNEECFIEYDVTELVNIFDNLNKLSFISSVKSIQVNVDESMFSIYDCSELVTVVNTLKSLSEQISEVKKEYDNIVEQMKQFKVCPLCNQEIGDAV